MKSVSLRGCQIARVSRSELMDELKTLLIKGAQCRIFTINAHHVYLLGRDCVFRRAYESAGIVLADGVSVVSALRLLGSPVKERCSGADMFPEICGLAAALRKRVFILGGTAGSEQIASRKLKKEFEHVEVEAFSPPCGFENDPDETEYILNRINSCRADILFVCVGAPKSEKWLFEHMSRLDVKLAFSFGDAVNFYAGVKMRAPLWAQRAGMEWFFRFLLEPGRLWKRYLIANIFFVNMFLSEFCKTIFRKRHV